MQEDSDSSAEERREGVGPGEQGDDDGSDQGPEGEDSSSDLEDYGE